MPEPTADIEVRPFGSHERPVQVVLIWRDGGRQIRRGRFFEPIPERRWWRVGQVLYRVNNGPVIEHAGPWVLGHRTWSVAPNPNFYNSQRDLEQWWDRVVEDGGDGTWEAEGFELREVGEIRLVVAERARLSAERRVDRERKASHDTSQ